MERKSNFARRLTGTSKLSVFSATIAGNDVKSTVLRNQIFMGGRKGHKTAKRCNGLENTKRPWVSHLALS
ncbi:hypothetical protein I3842_10G055400 [Carya illinoinensis]|uniref:Uncharacterized protein n=1 Tax=Carya illinoinensis TaxID=32201 RepID=A0A922DUS0_CARIL|nr:hypothetical protein I3842_10G055400 [Carya illinoinensis]